LFLPGSSGPQLKTVYLFRPGFLAFARAPTPLARTRVPACVRARERVCVRAARTTRRDFSAYQTVVSNFPPARRFPACAGPGRRKKLPVTSAIGEAGQADARGRGRQGLKSGACSGGESRARAILPASERVSES